MRRAIGTPETTPGCPRLIAVLGAILLLLAIVTPAGAHYLYLDFDNDDNIDTVQGTSFASSETVTVVLQVGNTPLDPGGFVELNLVFDCCVGSFGPQSGVIYTGPGPGWCNGSVLTGCDEVLPLGDCADPSLTGSIAAGAGSLSPGTRISLGSFDVTRATGPWGCTPPAGTIQVVATGALGNLQTNVLHLGPDAPVPAHFTFDDGTGQGWWHDGTFVPPSSTPTGSNFVFDWVDAVDYPSTSDPADGNGALSLQTSMGAGVSGAGDFWITRFRSPALTEFPAWQAAGGNRIRIRNELGSNDVWAQLYVRIFDFDQGSERFFYYPDAIPPIPNGTWATINHDWADGWNNMADPPLNYEIRDIFVNVWGLVNPPIPYDGSVYVDEAEILTTCELDVLTHSFGDVGVNMSAQLDVTISNSGVTALTGLIGESCGEFSVSPTSYNVPAGGSQVFTVTFAPTSPGSKNCQIDLDLPCGDLSVSGNGVPAGACCFVTGACTIEFEENCFGPNYDFDGSPTCSPNPCPILVGACCLPSNSCVLDTEIGCAMGPGSFLGVGTTCDPDPCPHPGACCTDTGCVFVEESECISLGGVYQGQEVLCSAVVPPPPTGVAATDAQCNQVTVSWNTVPSATDYEVFRDGDSLGIDPDGTPPFIDTVTGTYSYTVRALNGACPSAQSTADNGTGIATPAVPTNVSASDTECEQITISWNTVAGATGYEIFRDDGSLGLDPDGAPPFVDTATGTYSYTVRALNGACPSAQSTADNGTGISHARRAYQCLRQRYRVRTDHHQLEHRRRGHGV